ncbi:MAG: hypothetical protein IKA63_03880 [Clostridia bacterium]|nr:hypothetical protein [Clostridia bacterium]
MFTNKTVLITGAAVADCVNRAVDNQKILRVTGLTSVKEGLQIELKNVWGGTMHESHTGQ